MGTMPQCDPSQTYTQAVWPKPSPADLQRFPAGVSEVSRFSCMKFLGVSGVFDYAGPTRARAIAFVRVACRTYYLRRRPGCIFSQLNVPPRLFPCLRFVVHLAMPNAKLGAKVDRYSFLVRILHSLLHTVLARRTNIAITLIEYSRHRLSRDFGLLPDGIIPSLHRWGLWYGRAIGARVRGSVVHLGLRVVHYYLPATHCRGVFLPHVELMAHGGKFLAHFRCHSRLNHEVAPTLWTDSETGVLQSLLDIHAVVDQVGNELRVGQRLVRSSHDPLSLIHISEPTRLG